MATVVAVYMKRKKEIKPSFQSKVFCVAFLFSPCFGVLFSKIGRIKLDAVWVKVN
jgi:hypothetical protein